LFGFLLNAQESENKETGKICFLRSTGLRASTVSLKTFLDGTLYCKLNNNRYSVQEVPIGNYSCFIQLRGLKLLKNTEKLDIEVKSGKITYIQFYLEDEFLSFKFHSREISEDRAKEMLKNLKEDKKCL
jgi:hypothetical protein